jgi:ABC-type transporter Mla subunit MlaD
VTENKHVKAINDAAKELAQGNIWYVDDALQVIASNTDTLAEQVDRLREALRAAAALADERGKRLSPYYPSVLSEGGQGELGLCPGDITTEEGP